VDDRFVDIDLHLMIFTEQNITFELLLLINRNYKMLQPRTPTPTPSYKAILRLRLGWLQLYLEQLHSKTSGGVSSG
jgi:hypothetical protein